MPARQPLHQPAGKAAFGQDAGAVGHFEAAFGQGFELRVAVYGALVHHHHVREVEAVADHGAPVGADAARACGQPVMAVAVKRRGRGFGGRRVQPDQSEAFDAVPGLCADAAAFADGRQFGVGLLCRVYQAAVQAAFQGAAVYARAFQVCAHVGAECVCGAENAVFSAVKYPFAAAQVAVVYFAGRKAGYAGDGIPCLRPVVPKVFCRVVVVHMVRMMGGCQAV